MDRAGIGNFLQNPIIFIFVLIFSAPEDLNAWRRHVRLCLKSPIMVAVCKLIEFYYSNLTVRDKKSEVISSRSTLLLKPEKKS